VLDKKTLCLYNKSMKPLEILANMELSKTKVSTVEEGHRVQQQDFRVVHLCSSLSAPEGYRKKSHFHITKTPSVCRLDQWIYENLVDSAAMSAYLNRYRPGFLKAGRIDQIDAYILKKHYEPKAIKILKAKGLWKNEAAWRKPRHTLSYQRKSPIKLADGYELPIDGPMKTLFILRHNGKNIILGIGDSGSSGHREQLTLWTAVCHDLSKSQRIPNYMFEYTPNNKLKYLGKIYGAVVTPSFGSNLELPQGKYQEITKNAWSLNYDWHARKVQLFRKGAPRKLEKECLHER
jgi:hypothetical protein